MRIGTIGLNGRMSQAVIEEVNNHPDCTISGVLVRKKSEHHLPLYENIQELAAVSDAIVDFSSPANSLDIIRKLANTKIIVVCGTTGFTAQEFAELNKAALTLVYSANMSIGVNLLQSLVKTVADKLSDDFDPVIIDIHHRHKKDSPSGTALMLAKTIEDIISKKVQISSLRIGEIPGEHSIIFSNSDETITLSHQAFNRNIFAKGAIRACFWGQNKKLGIYSMQDVLND